MPRGKEYKSPVFSDNVLNYDAVEEKNQNTIGQRISAARKSRGMSLAIFSRYLEDYGLNVSTKAVSKWETGDTVPNAYQLLAVCAALDIEEPLPFFAAAYKPALNEKGMEKLREYKEDLIASGKYRPAQPASKIVRFVDIPVSELRVSAGTGQFLDEGRFDMVSFPEDKVPAGTDFGVRVSGDSMEPVYHDGQIVFVQKCERVEPGQVGVFVYDAEGYLKMYSEQEPDESLAEELTDSYGVIHPQPVLKSYNAAYEPRPILPGARFEVVGRVL